MQTVFESNLGTREVKCRWCKVTSYDHLIVNEEQTAEMFFILKRAYERILFLQHYDAARINEITKLEIPVITKLAPHVCRGESPAYACCSESIEYDCSKSCGTEDEQHCPV